ncbi:MAG TPA: PAS domain S-box protein, partial [Acidimicrobiales bacterium]|nr:PAS domain S-box protein [Acidimicrobiales bacterium]
GKTVGEIVHPDDFAARVERIAQVAQTGHAFFEVRLRDTDGGYHAYSMDLHDVPGVDGAVATRFAHLRNMDAQVEAREALRRAHDLLRDAMQAEIDPHVLLGSIRDGDGRVVDFTILEANAAAIAYNRVGREGYVGTSLVDRHPGLAPGGLLAHMARTAETGEPLVLDDFHYRSPDGAYDNRFDIRAVKVGDGISYTWRDVTARNELVDQYRLLAENASDVVFRTDPSLGLVWVSPSVVDLFGHTPDDLIGKSMVDYIHPDDLPRIAEAIERNQHGERELGETRMLRADGEWTWVSLFARTLYDGDGRVIGFAGSLRGAEDERARRQELAESEARYRLLAENGWDVVVVGDGAGGVEWISDSIETLTGFSPAEIVGQHYAAYIHPDDWWKMEASRPTPDRLSTPPVEFRVKTTDGRWRWVSGVARRVDDPLTQRSINVISIRDAQAEVEARQAIAESEDRYRLLAENASDVVLLIDANSTCAWASPSVSNVLGWAPEDLVGRPASEFLLAEDLGRVVDVHPSVAGGLTPAGTVRARCASGEYLWMSARSTATDPSSTNGSGRVVALRDVSSEITAREDLLASESRYRMLAENASDVVLDLDESGVIRWASPSLERVLGWSPQSWVGHPSVDFVHPDDRDEVVRRRDLEQRQGTSGLLEARYRDAAGEYHWMSREGHVVRSTTGSVAALVVGLRLIDAEVEARRSAAQSEGRYQVLAENASDVVLEVDDQGEIQWVSPSVEQFLGWRASDLVGTRSFDFIHPDDTAKAAAFRTLVAMGQSVEEYEIRCRRADGESRWVGVRARPIVQRDGRVTGAIFSLRDCQAEVLARRALTTLSKGSRALMRATDEHELLKRMCEVAVDEGGYSFAWYGRKVHDDARSVEKVASSDAHHEYLEAIDPTWSDDASGLGPTGRAMKLGEVIVARDIPSDPRFAPWLGAALEHGFRCSVALPVRADGDVDGALMVYAEEPDAFDETAVAILTDLAAEMGYGIQRLRDQARLIESQSQQTLLTKAIEHAVDAVMVMDPGFRIVYANASAERTSGYSLDELIGKNPDVLDSGLESDEHFAEMLTTVYDGHAWSGTMISRRKDATIYEEDVTVSPILEVDGSLSAFVAVRHDVSEERRLASDLTRVTSDRASVVEVMRELRPATTLEATAWMFCDAATRLADIDVAAVLLIDPDRRFRPIAESGTSLFSHKGPFYTDEPEFLLQVAKKPIALAMDVARWTANPDLIEAALREGITDMVLAPVRFEGALIGVLVLATKDAERRQTAPDRFAHFEELGSFAGSLFGAQAIDFQNAEVKRAQIDAIIAAAAFHPVFQPFLDLQSGEIVGFEALTRFDDGVNPGQRFNDAAAYDRAGQLEAACARAALEAAHALPAGAFLTLNFSPSTILSGQAATAVALAGRPVVIEVTENMRIANYAELRAAVDRIPNVRLAVDDTGSGYASLHHILELRPDFVKLDWTMIRDVDTNAVRQAMVAGICHFAEQSGTVLIAEGVETEAEANTLRDLGVTLGEGAMLAQGYYFGRPEAPPA